MLAAYGCVPPVQRSKIPRLGFVSPASRDRELFVQALRGLGYLEGQSIAIESRTAGETDEQLTPAIEELVRLPADIIVIAGTPAALAAKRTTRTIPIVFLGVGDPVVSNVVASFARPGGNVTGVTNVSPQAIGKGLEYLLQVAPDAARVAFMGNLGANPGSRLQFAAAQSAATTIGVQIVDFGLRDAGDIDRIFETFSNSGVKAVMVGTDAITINNQARIVDLAARYRLPALYNGRDFAVAGGLISYGPNYAALWERVADLVDKILHGRAPGDLPVEQPTRFDLVVNSKTAQSLGITVPQAILVQATEVIR
jgi:putative ABC transport system substrate-binding protein